MPTKNAYKYSQLKFLDGFSIKKLKHICDKELLPIVQNDSHKWTEEEKRHAENTLSACEFVDTLYDPNRQFEWNFYERLAEFRDFLQIIKDSKNFDKFERDFLNQVYTAIPAGNLNVCLSEDQIQAYPLSEAERIELLENLTSLLKSLNIDAAWLHNLPLQGIYLLNAPLRLSQKEIPRAQYVNGNIYYNSGARPNGKEGFAIDSPEGLIYLLHELRHCWQSQDPEWMERYQNKDISIETDAFEKQFELEKAQNLETPSDPTSIKFFDSVSPSEQEFDIKSKPLWRRHGYGCPDKNYVFPGNAPYCIQDSIKERSNENNPLH